MDQAANDEPRHPMKSRPPGATKLATAGPHSPVLWVGGDRDVGRCGEGGEAWRPSN